MNLDDDYENIYKKKQSKKSIEKKNISKSWIITFTHKKYFLLCTFKALLIMLGILL